MSGFQPEDKSSNLLQRSNNAKMREINKYSLRPDFLPKEFDTMEELLEYVLDFGVDPSYEITINGEPSGETAMDFLGFTN